MILAGHWKTARRLSLWEPTGTGNLAVLVKQGGEPHPCHWKCKSNRKDKSHGWHVSHCILFSLVSAQIHSTPKNANWHTTQFCANDITFWDKNLCVIQNDSSLNDCPMPTQQWSKLTTKRMVHEGVPSITKHYTLRNAWSGHSQRDSTTSWPTSTDPTPNDIISTYFGKGMAYVLQTTHINTAIKQAVKATGLVEQGFPLTCVSSASLLVSRRSGGNASQQNWSRQNLKNGSLVLWHSYS
jgi:hypothetical protein